MQLFEIALLTTEQTGMGLIFYPIDSEGKTDLSLLSTVDIPMVDQQDQRRRAEWYWYDLHNFVPRFSVQ